MGAVVLWSSALCIYVLVTNWELDADKESFIKTSTFQRVGWQRRDFMMFITVCQASLTFASLVSAFWAYRSFGWRIYKRCAA